MFLRRAEILAKYSEHAKRTVAIGSGDAVGCQLLPDCQGPSALRLRGYVVRGPHLRPRKAVQEPRHEKAVRTQPCENCKPTFVALLRQLRQAARHEVVSPE